MISPPVTLTWTRDQPAEAWDRDLAAVGGHPLQSALWGDARRAVDGIDQFRWSASSGDRLVLMARCEVRRVARVGRVAWIPRGPAGTTHEASGHAFRELLADLRRRGFLLCIDDPYTSDTSAGTTGRPLFPKAKTAWIDLTVGRDRLSNTKWRHGVRTAERAGILVSQTREPGDVAAFFALCQEISSRKHFDLSASEPLLQTLIAAPPSDAVEARLFVARTGNDLAAGAVVIRCGRTLHYFWGGADRRFPKSRASESLHWTVIEWALANGLERYDLEGIDPVNNPGTYKFKMEMGAAEVDLPGRRAYPLRPAGRAALAIGRWMGRI